MHTRVRRVALDREHFENDTDVALAPEHASAFLEAMSTVRHDGLSILLRQAAGGFVTVTGPAWRPLISSNEVVSLQGSVCDFLVPVKKEPRLACPRDSWDETDVEIYLTDASKNRVGKIVVGPDREYVEVSVTATGRLHDNEVAFDSEMKAVFETLLEHATPSPESILSKLPKPPLCAWKPHVASRWCFVPEWVVSFLIRWASCHLRVHVVASAASDLDADCNGPPALMFVEHAVMEHVSFKGVASRQLTLHLHQSTCGCFCKNHRTHSRHANGTHSRTELVLAFCGCRNSSNGRCPYHPKRESPPFQNDDPIASSICMHGLSLKLRCVHQAAAIPDTHSAAQKSVYTTVLDVPLDSDPYAVSFAAACVELTDGEPSAEAVGELADYVETAFADAMRADKEEREAVSMSRRDQMIESMLRSGELFYGLCPNRKSGKQALRKRKHPGAVPKWMAECMETHAHLLPSK